MKRLTITILSVFLTSFVFAQSSAEISAAKAMARSYGYSEEEINNALRSNDVPNGTTYNASLQSGTTLNNDIEYNTVVELVQVDTTKIETSDIFGHKFFVSRGLSLVPAATAPVSDDYILGVGDEIQISIWGASNSNMYLIVANDGTVNVNGVGPVMISGMTMGAVRNNLKSSLSNYYPGLTDGTTNLKVSLGKAGGVSVYVLGEVAVPGVYSLPALCNLPSAIYLAGGVKHNGSVRNINLFRNGKKVSWFDLYDFAFNGRSGGGFKLQNGDIISVESTANVVELEGEVHRTMKFELTEKETLKDLIKYAGGFTAYARRDVLHVDRISTNGNISFDVPANLFPSFQLQDGDRVFVAKGDGLYKNKVQLSGNVLHEGPYSISENMHTVGQLIAAAGGLKEGTYMKRAYINRLDDDRLPISVSFSLDDIVSGRSDIELVRDDEIVVYSNESLRDTKVFVEIRGEVNSPGSYSFRDGMTLGDLLLLAGGTRDGADLTNVEIAVRGRDDASSIFSVNILDGQDGPSMKLNSYDKVFVRSKEKFREIKTIQVVGEVKYPGYYAVEKNSVRLSDIISRTSGFTADAYVKGARLKRVYQDNEIELQEIVGKVASTNKFVRDTTALDSLKNAIRPGDTYSVAIDLESAIKNPNTDVDVILRDGDVIEVPQMNNTVKISGGVYLPNVVAYNPDYGWRDYINFAGGFAKGAKRNKLYVVYQDGSSAVRGSSRFHMEPGMEIVVPQVDKGSSRKMSTGEWAAVASVATSMVSVVVMLINQLSR